MDGSTGPATAAPSAQARKSAPYLFFGQTTSLCETCLDLVPAKVIVEDGSVFYLKRCRAHGVQKTLICDDLAYYKAQKDWLKPGDRPLSPQTRTEHGCPWDCGGGRPGPCGAASMPSPSGTGRKDSCGSSSSPILGFSGSWTCSS